MNKSNQKKLLIITTTNEDFIEKLRSSVDKSNEFVDLESNEFDLRSLSTDVRHPMNLSFFAQLTNLNNTDGQIYRQILQKTKKKSLESKCLICDDRAIGFNYDVLSCASCKAFFRRNAHQNITNLRCLAGQGQCLINKTIRRKCQKCRLEKCLSLGMKKEYLLTDEEKFKRKQRSQGNSTIEINEQIFDDIDQLMMEIDQDEELNKIKEKFDLIEEISTKYSQTFLRQSLEHFLIDVRDRNTALLSWSRSTNTIGVSMIYFLRQIEDFENLNLDDRFHLIKWNLFLLFPLLKSFYFRSTLDYCTFDQTDEGEKHRQFFLLCGDFHHLREQFVRLVFSLVRITEQNPTILSLLSLILIFSKGFSPMNENILYQDSSRIDQLQSFYLELLWIYLINRYGQIQTSKFFIDLLKNLFLIQSTVSHLKDFFHQQISTLEVNESVTPLLQTILNIS